MDDDAKALYKGRQQLAVDMAKLREQRIQRVRRKLKGMLVMGGFKKLNLAGGLGMGEADE